MSLDDRTVPAALDAEQAVIGSLLVDRAMFSAVRGIVSPADFHSPQNAAILSAMYALDDAEKPCDKISVATMLRDQGSLEMVGGIQFLSDCMNIVPTAASAAYYASIVAEKAKMRAIIRAAERISTLAFDPENSPLDVLAQAETILQSAASSAKAGFSGGLMPELVRAQYDRIARVVDGEKPRAYSSPWRSLDAMTGGFRPGELVIWAASPAMGKSHMVAMLADHASAVHGGVAFFAMEMGSSETVARLMASYSGISTRSQRLGHVREDQWPKLSEAMSRLASRDLRIFDAQPHLNVADIRFRVKRLAKELESAGKSLSAIVIDHVGWIKDVYESTRESKHDRLSKALMELVELAREVDAPLHCVCHMNRQAKDGEPNMFDIRDGGNVEGHATTILFPWRPKPDSAIAEEQREGKIIVAKAREGTPGAVEMQFIGKYGWWLEMGESKPWFEFLEHVA